MKKILLSLVISIIACMGLSTISIAANEPNPELVKEQKKYKYPDLVTGTYAAGGNFIITVHYAVREILQADSINIIDGYEDGTFRPDEPIQRDEFIKMLIVLATNKSFNFNNVDTTYPKNYWAGPYVTIAEMQGVIDKNQYTQAELTQPITRLEMILMLAKTQIKMKGIPPIQVGTLRFDDIGDLSQEEKDYILHATGYDLLEGMRDGKDLKLFPQRFLTRGEAAAAIMRVY